MWDELIGLGHLQSKIPEVSVAYRVKAITYCPQVEKSRVNKYFRYQVQLGRKLRISGSELI